VDELAHELRVTPDDILEALDAGAAYRTAPLTRPEDDSDREPAVLGEEDGELAQVDSRMAVRRLLDTLPQRERTIVYLRFFGSLTQQEIAERLGMSQVHVSRLLRQCMSQMESALEGDGIGDNDV
jgi:RNA polymerase sigma-B factor